MATRPLRWALAGLLLAAGAARPAAACGTASCSLTARGPESGLQPAGSWRFDLTFREVDQSRRLYGHQPVTVFGAEDPPVLRPRLDFEGGRLIGNYHQEYAARGRFAQADLSYGLSRRLTLVASFPFWSERRVDHLLHPAVPSANHDEPAAAPARGVLRTSGFGDVQLMARYAVRGPLVVGLGLQVPTGDHRRMDEYAQIADPMSQPGSGSVAGIATAAVSGRLARLDAGWAALGSLQVSRANGLGYRPGPDAILVVGASRSVLAPVAATLQAKLQHTGRSRFLGLPSPSTGGTVVSLVPGARVSGPGGLALVASLQVPLFQHVNEGQLGARTVLNLGFSLAR